MTNKFSMLIKYEHIDLIEQAGLSNDNSWLLIKALINYDRTGEEPVFKNRDLSLLFMVIKVDIDKNKKKWEETVKTKSEAGKKGMDKRWGNKQDITEITQITPVIDHNTDNTCYKDITEITDLDSGSGDQPPLTDIIKQVSQKHGFFLDTRVANNIQRCGIDPSWFTNKYSFLEFCAERVKKKYPDNAPDEIKSIFISAVKKWEDLRAEYPSWLVEKEKQDKKIARDQKIKLAMKNHPTKCEYCGGEDLREFCESYQCKKCSSISSFNKENLKWEWRK